MTASGTEAASVEICAYDADWPVRFEAERARLEQALGPAAVSIEHIGSTSVPGLAAKPVIDILVGTLDLAAIDACNDAMQAAGYEVRGESGFAGRRYFRRITPERVRLAHVHAYRLASQAHDRHLAVRDYLRAHPDMVAAYARLKREIVALRGVTRQAYAARKAEFVDELEALALAWRGGGMNSPRS